MRTETLALDASCVGKLFLAEAESADFREWYRRMKSVGVEFQAPHLLQYELGNILRRVFRDSPQKGEILQRALDGIELVQVDPADPFQHGSLTYYDASYLCVAGGAGALATYDEEMASAAHSFGNPIRVWTAERIRASIKPGFVAWMRKRGTQDVAHGMANDKLAQDSWSYLEFCAYLDEFRRPSDAAREALDEAFSKFAAASHH